MGQTPCQDVAIISAPGPSHASAILGCAGGIFRGEQAFSQKSEWSPRRTPDPGHADGRREVAPKWARLFSSALIQREHSLGVSTLPTRGFTRVNRRGASAIVRSVK